MTYVAGHPFAILPDDQIPHLRGKGNENFSENQRDRFLKRIFLILVAKSPTTSILSRIQPLFLI